MFTLPVGGFRFAPLPPTPDPLLTGALMLFEGANAESTDGVVTSWPDTRVSGFSMNLIGGNPVKPAMQDFVEFDGAGDFLVGTIGSGTTLANRYTTFFYRFRLINTGGMPLARVYRDGDDLSSNTNTTYHVLQGGSNRFAAYYDFGTLSFTNAPNETLPVNVWTTLRASRVRTNASGTNWEYRLAVNGVVDRVVAGSGDGPASATLNRIRVGNSPGLQDLHGDLAFIGVYDSDVLFDDTGAALPALAEIEAAVTALV